MTYITNHPRGGQEIVPLRYIFDNLWVIVMLT